MYARYVRTLCFDCSLPKRDNGLRRVDFDLCKPFSKVFQTSLFRNQQRALGSLSKEFANLQV